MFTRLTLVKFIQRITLFNVIQQIILMKSIQQIALFKLIQQMSSKHSLPGSGHVSQIQSLLRGICD